MNPVFPLSVLVPVSLLLAAIFLLGAWKGGAGLPLVARRVLVVLRFAGGTAVIALLFNPGRWVNPSDSRPPAWLVLLDNSASMARPVEGRTTRANIAGALALQARDLARTRDLPLRIHPFADALQAAVQDPPATADGTATRLLPVVSRALADSSGAGEPLAGIVVLSDGRQTLGPSQAELDDLSLRARSLGVAVHTVAVGAGAALPDIALIQPRSALTAFAGQKLRIPLVLKSSGFDPLKVEVALRDETGKVLASQNLLLPPGKTVVGAFEVAAPARSAVWTLETPVQPGEAKITNNKGRLLLRILTSKTRVFLVEGAPYWDSKFLAQLLRAQPHVELQSVHRLSDQRYFRIDTDSNSETDRPVFPETLDALARYDLVVFGKNVDPFLTPENADIIRRYVRDRGGAVLFARGKPTTMQGDALEALEPVEWGAATFPEFRFTPNREGENVGLFGQALPAPDAALWAALPALQDGRQIAQVKPFTRVLAEGTAAGVLAGNPSGVFPALLVRRHGQGVVGLVNGDGMWRWDFFPDARELGNCYEDFWVQLIQWMSTYSEFLPGQDFSLRLSAPRGEVGEPVSGTLSFRGTGAAPLPTVLVADPAGRVTPVVPAATTDAAGLPQWRFSHTPDAPGVWTLRVADPRPGAPPAPEAAYTVPAPPAENDDITPDPEWLEAIARATGGTAARPADVPDLLKRLLVTRPPSLRAGGAVWKSSWRVSHAALLITFVLALEWFIRRRRGLA